MSDGQETEFDDELEEFAPLSSISAVVHGTDWTTETIVNQIRRGNIILNPQFQRRDAWSIPRKSLLIESLIIGLPVPQIVLAESRQDRGKFIVLDGKQRLLTLLQFWGLAFNEQGESAPNNGFALSRLTLRPVLSRKTFEDLSSDFDLEGDFNALSNQSIRTMVIRNWESDDFLHQVFLRLNTGSVKLSPQELRQALHPGQFTKYVDEASAGLTSLRELLNISSPDPRMRDVEILGRYLAFKFFADSYPGRMKGFLDESFNKFNQGWSRLRDQVVEAVNQFDLGLRSLLEIFNGRPARKPGSPQFNRAIFDALIYYQSKESVRDAAEAASADFIRAYEELFSAGSTFSRAVESDTAGRPNTKARFDIWSEQLSSITGGHVDPPNFPVSEV
ncbi:MAG: DUF262 domain-containing protein [Verrucomicrobiaceae bacterium]|nr:MAG: DUF262 domain-containing protein [Verrucomicrobiaceae bacterium]